MDPDDNLNEQLEISQKILSGDEDIDEEDVTRLAELVVAMHEWLIDGGYRPGAWDRSGD